MNKKLVALSGFILLSTPLAATAQFIYAINNGTITILGYSGPGGAVIIPDTIQGVPVTTIGNQAFYNKASVTSVTIPNGVTTLEYAAFDACTGMTNVTIPATLTSIGDAAFAFCYSLATVTIPGSVTN